MLLLVVLLVMLLVLVVLLELILLVVLLIVQMAAFRDTMLLSFTASLHSHLSPLTLSPSHPLALSPPAFPQARRGVHWPSGHLRL